ncbi:TATA box-binding protein-associated factor RNA polymerase I subunit A [Parambassis ranga]|uniref:TATA box-binding protein-associated factor RNA polymerase I subunit A n=1 Tax=Parambassis ranga TaxID=210632 RepID=A0A6P7HRL3_9TELE|nr:TATA box-binding protein-associated factor RNA polymerase I subunit A [Parambassis ranga]
MDDLERELGPLVDLEDDNNSSDDNSTKRQKRNSLFVLNPMCAEASGETGAHQTQTVCLKKIREAMLHHRWQEAAEYMACFPQMLENRSASQHYKELLWRMCTEILHHFPNSTMEDYMNIYERMKHSGVKHYLMICLEHSFHLLLHGRIQDAKQQLTAAESWRYGHESAAQLHRSKLIQAYRSLLDYIVWCDKKATNSENNHLDCNNDDQGMHNYFRQASVNLQEILKNPGIWDPFILSYVDMLEFYEDHEEARNVLNNYAYDSSFPPNPNAHVYLYQYLKRHHAPEKKLMKVLKILHVLVPSHELMLEYSSLLLHSEKQSDIEKALGVLLEMLDFACWRSNLDVWRSLKAVILKLQIQTDWQNAVGKKMADRKDWWPTLHFTSFHASKDSVENPELWEVKASLTKILCPDRNLKYSTEQETNDGEKHQASETLAKKSI